MARVNQVMQVGDIQENIHFYIEDYAYTYLKKQKGKEKAKYFLYGEREEHSQVRKIYIYGISRKPKMEQSYFKEYYPLGFLKINGDDMIWISLKGQEEKMTGFYVFYAPNQAMQEYLVDHREEEKEEKAERKIKMVKEEERLPIREKMIAIKRSRPLKRREEFRNEKFIFPISGILAACLVLLALSTSNGREKIEVFKQIVFETFSEDHTEQEEKEFIIEEKKAAEEYIISERDASTEKETEKTTAEEPEPDEQQKQPEPAAETTFSQIVMQEKIEPEEYIVKDGDTLAGICRQKYGNLEKMKEICDMNDIKNADYIAPGQKIYLP